MFILKPVNRLVSRTLIALLIVFSLLPGTTAQAAETPAVPAIGTNHPTEPGQVMLFKEAKPVAGLVNTWDVTLRIEGMDSEKTSDTIIVLDRSLSMQGSKWTNAKAAARVLVNTLLPETGNNGNRVALVAFETQPSQVIGFTETRGPITDAIDNLNLGTYTHTQGGMHTAADLMSTSQADIKTIVLLSDGDPTRSYSMDNPNNYLSQQNIPGVGTRWATTSSAPQSEYNYSAGTTVGNDATMYYRYDNPTGTANDKYYNHGNSAIAEAGYAKDDGYTVYTIALQVGTVGQQVLQAMASSGGYVSTNDPTELQAIFSNIAGAILSAIQGTAAVSDPMGTGFEIPAANVAGITTIPSTYPATYDAGAITWNPQLTEPLPNPAPANPLLEGIKYAQLTYRIEINDDILGISPVPEDGLYPTNGATSITYTDFNGTKVVAAFPSPKVNPVLYKIRKIVQNKDGADITASVNRTFTVNVQANVTGFSYNKDFELDSDSSSTTLLTSLRPATTYNFAETLVQPGDLSDYDITYYLNSTDNPPIAIVDGRGAFDILDDNTADQELIIVNREKPATLTIIKELVGEGVEDGTFQFEIAGPGVSGDSGYATQIVSLPDNVDDNWSVTVGNLAFGNYTVTETAPTTGYTTTVSVDDGPAELAKAKTITLSFPGTTQRSVTFTNYELPAITFSGDKDLTGRDTALDADEFYFQLYASDTAWAQGLQIGSDVGNTAVTGAFSFPEITYTAAGDYYYLLKEKTPSGVGGVTDDTDVYQIKVVVDDNDEGQLVIASVLVDGTEMVGEAGFDFSFDFDNEYTPKSTAITFSGDKDLTGRDTALDADEFYFQLYASDTAWAQGLQIGSDVGNTAVTGAFSFPEITYTAAGDYYYLLKEKTPSGVGGVTDDTDVYQIKVVVDDNDEGQLVIASVLVDGTEMVGEAGFDFSFDFDNEYTPKSTAITFSGDKDLTGRDTALDADEFYFQLYASDTAWAQGLQIGSDVGNTAVTGAFSFPEITYTAAGDYYYLLKEKTPSGVGGVTDDTDVYQIKVVVDDNDEGQLVITSVLVDGTEMVGEAGFDFSFDFDNEYTPKSTAITFSGDKDLTGRDTALDADEFYFQLYASDTAWAQGLQIGSDVGNTAVTGAFSFPEITYTAAGDYYYLLKEKTPSGVGGVTDDTDVYQIKVVVDDNDEGQLVIASVLVDGTEMVGEAGFDFSFDFDNEYTPKSTAITFSGDKDLTGRDTALDADEFYFQLYASDTAWAQGLQIGSDVGNTAVTGAFSFPEITYTAAGDYYYLLKEKTPSGVGGVTDDTDVYQIKVVVDDNDEGQLVITSVLVDGTEMVGEAGFDFSFDFDNEYTPKSTAITFSGDKDLTGRDTALDADEFYFQLYASDTAWAQGLQIGSDVGNTAVTGAFSFPEITYTAAGDYYYLLKEKTPSGVGGVTDDTDVYQIKVVVDDNDEGQLVIASVLVDGTEMVGEAGFDFSFDFDNEYTPKSTAITFSGDKDLTGRDTALDADEFYFQLYASDTAWAQGLQIGSDVGNTAVTGAFSFPEITYTAAGDYYYLLKEKTPSGVGGVTDDTDVYQIKVVVDDNDEGQLVIASVLVDGTEMVGEAGFDFSFDFDNEYTPKSTAITFSGDKDLTGRDTALDADEFYFQLYASDTAWAQGLQIGSDVGNTAVTGAFSFPEITYTAAGDYYYLLKEKTPSGVGGVTDDTDVYQIKVVVDDNDEGQLVIASVLVDGTEMVGEAGFDFSFDFDNTYATAGSLTLTGTKAMTGRALKDGDNFSYTVKEGDTIVSTGSSDETGVITFTGITYTEADMARSPITLKVTEDTPSPAIPGVTPDPASYEVVVTLADDGEGNITATPDYPAGDGLVFTNTYTGTGDYDIDLQLNPTKELTGRDLAADEFTFELLNEEGEVMQTVKNTADGNLPFGLLRFNQEAIGEHRFTIREVIPEDKDARLTYDTMELTFVLSVVDNGDGTLKVEQVGEPEAKVFTNVYVAPTPTPGPTATPRPIFSPVFVTLSLQKTLQGRALKANEFHFILRDAAGNELEQVGNTEDGRINFGARAFSRTGIYLYTVEEVKGIDKGVNYDPTIFTARIVVRENGDVLSYSVEYLKDGVPFGGEIAFRNVYNPPKTGDSQPAIIIMISSAALLMMLLAFGIRKEDPAHSRKR